MTSSQGVALGALTAALRGEALAHVYVDGNVEVGASSGRRFTVDGFGLVVER